MNKIFVYALIDPRTSEVRYVGVSKNPYLRYRLHVGDSEHAPQKVHGWILELRALGLRPIIQILECFDDDGSDIWREKESSWILYYRSIGSPLLNTMVRGGGNIRVSEKARRNLSEGCRNKAYRIIIHKRYWWTLSTEYIPYREIKLRLKPGLVY
jgi:hypothetical protein